MRDKKDIASIAQSTGNFIKPGLVSAIIISVVGTLHYRLSIPDRKQDRSSGHNIERKDGFKISKRQIDSVFNTPTHTILTHDEYIKAQQQDKEENCGPTNADMLLEVLYPNINISLDSIEKGCKSILNQEDSKHTGRIQGTLPADISKFINNLIAPYHGTCFTDYHISREKLKEYIDKQCGLMLLVDGKNGGLHYISPIGYTQDSIYISNTNTKPGTTDKVLHQVFSREDFERIFYFDSDENYEFSYLQGICIVITRPGDKDLTEGGLNHIISYLSSLHENTNNKERALLYIIACIIRCSLGKLSFMAIKRLQDVMIKNNNKQNFH